MLKTEILSVGTELLMGQIANTDAQYISKRLPEAGAGVYYHTVVGDNAERFRDCLGAAFERADIVITTGGLGPTQDDLTKQAAAGFFGLPLVMHGESKKRIDDFFALRGLTPTRNNYRQAMMPEGAEVLRNDNGTAPGCIIRGSGRLEGKTLILLPGPPGELIPMFDRYVMPFYASLSDNCIDSKFVCISGTGESAVEEMLIGLIDGQTDPTYATYAGEGNVVVRVTAHGATAREAAEKTEAGVRAICGIMGDDVYSVTGEKPEEALVRLLRESGFTMSAAESLTGGMIASSVVSVPGASSVFKGGCVVYTDEMKRKMLGVKEETISAFTAVSAGTCREMAEGMRRMSGSDVAVAVTGYAGPGTGDEPVGLVYIGVSSESFNHVNEFRFTGNREKIRRSVTVKAINLTRRCVLSMTEGGRSPVPSCGRGDIRGKADENADGNTEVKQ